MNSLGITRADDPPCVKLCDFGFAKNWEDQSTLYTQIGTPVYMSPQMIHKSAEEGYDAQKADVWACGVLLFVMMQGKGARGEHTQSRLAVKVVSMAGSWLTSCPPHATAIRNQQLCSVLRTYTLPNWPNTSDATNWTCCPQGCSPLTPVTPTRIPTARKHELR